LPDAILDDPRIGWWLVMPQAAMSEAAKAFRDWLTHTTAQDPLDFTH
jgi:LysR family glycine cleavage system transcriptional activator